MRAVLWNKLARQDYFENIDYLLQNWSEKEAQKFIDEVLKLRECWQRAMLNFKIRIGLA